MRPIYKPKNGKFQIYVHLSRPSWSSN